MNDSILLIQSQDVNNKSMGTGFVVYSDEGGSFVLTCYHVLKSVGEAKVDDYEVTVIVQHKVYDLAVLYVKGLCNKEPFVLKATSLEGNQDEAVSLIGYRTFSGNEYRQNTRKAKLFDKGMHKEGKLNFEVWEVIAEKDNYILHGYSGSPLILNHQVIGVMTNKEQANRGFATSIKHLATVWDSMPRGLLLQESRENPFVGLSPFTQETKAFFFGRDKEVEEISNRLEKSNFLAVVGDSGSGKSSIIKAGIIPHYLENNAYTLELRPANNPYMELSNQLEKQISSENNEQLLFELHAFCEHSKTTLLIYIDQFEELFTLTPKDIRETFLETLLYLYRNNLDSKLKIDIIFTMRSDYFPQLQQYEQFYKLIMDEDGINQVLIKSMDKKQLKETIVKPLLKVELVHEAEANSFADLVILNMGNRANEVTLLQNALTIIWYETKQGKTLVEAYKDLGGIAGALPTLANETIEAISTKENKDIQAICLRLLKYAKKGNHTRRIAEKSEFSVKQWELVQLLSSALNSNGERAIQDDEKLGRLLKLSGKSKSNEQSVELIHETLITSWTTYSDWVQEFGLYKVTHDVVIEKSKEYKKYQEEKDFLLMGVDLNNALGLLNDEYRVFVSDSEVAYIEKSEKFRLEEKKKEETMLFNLKVAFRRLKIALAVLVGLLGISGYFWFEAEESKNNIVEILDNSVTHGLVSAQTGQYSLAQLAFRFVFTGFKESSDIKIQKVVVKALYGDAFVLEKTRNTDNAIIAYNKMIEYIIRNNISMDSYLAKAYYAKALIFDNSLHNINEAKKNYLVVLNFKGSKNKEVLNFVAGAYSRLAWFELFTKNFDRSVELAEKGIALNFSNPLIEINLAHAYLFVGGRENDAMRIYLKYKDNYKVIEDDFNLLKEGKVVHHSFNQIIQKIKLIDKE